MSTLEDQVARIKRVANAPSRVVGIVEHKDRIFVACETGIYELKDDVLHPVRFAFETDGRGPSYTIPAGVWAP